MDRPALLVDFGSTFTKLLLVDVPSGELLARAYHPTTVREGVAVGLQAGLAALAAAAGSDGARLVECASPRLACSSAAGGLKMVAIGLVRDLTAAAAARAALGAGARLLATYCHRLAAEEAAEVAQRRPDVVLLVGGTDGGDRQTLQHNAAALAALDPTAIGSVVVAGNKEATPEAVTALRRAGHDARPAANVLPELGVLRVEPAQDAIRRVFLERIVERKGLDRVRAWLDGVVLPTPAAVLQAAELLACGPPAAAAAEAALHDDAPGPLGDLEPLGDLAVVDVGGATTDVHSVADGAPRRPDVYHRGVPEPRAKRTVEGDLGLRESALPLWEAMAAADRWRPGAGAGVAARLRAYADRPGQVPGDGDQEGRDLDALLAEGAVALALERHAGSLEAIATPAGRFWVQRGKDLSGVGALIGTGGIFRTRGAAGAAALLGAALRAAAAGDPCRLLPRAPRLYVDRAYVLWAAGLLAPAHPLAAWRLARRSLAPGAAGGADSRPRAHRAGRARDGRSARPAAARRTPRGATAVTDY